MKPPLPSPERNVQIVEHGNEPVVYAPAPLAIEPAPHRDKNDSADEQPNLVDIGCEQMEVLLEEQIVEEIDEPPPKDTNQPNMISVGPVDSNSMDPQLLKNLGLV